MKLDLVILCVFSLSFISLTLSSSPPTNSSETSCPMDLNYVLIRIPFNISFCQNFNPPPNITLKDPTNNSCCVVLLSLFGIGLARRLKETSFFHLPDLPTSKSCLQDFQSKLTELSFPPNLVSYCFDPMQFVITPNTCAHIETTHDWVAKVGDSTPLDSACKPNLTDLSACDACVAAGFQAQSLLLRIDGNNSHATDCFYFAVLYAAGIVNQYGAESDGAISCIMGMGLTLGTNTPGSKKISQTKKVVGSLVGAICALVAVGMGICLYPRKQKHSSRVQSPNTVAMHPCHSGDQEAVKIISTQVLRTVTNNFSEENIVGRGGFGTVYKGELHDGTKIAVKRMESSIMNEKASAEFKSEIAVLTKVRHRNLTALLGYSLDGNERLLVYEYMPQGTLGRHLFNWKEEGLKPLEWTGRLTIALDVARGLEYLHGLSRQSFIHRDLKPSNILLGDDMHAKIADFGLVRLVPDGKNSVVTRIVGTFGYLAPEYGVTGRVTTKVDVFSFGVILMELITGRKALDETQSEDSLHVVPWFRRMHINKDTFQQAIDPTIELDEDTLASISTVAELAGHCSAGDRNQRPDMGHVVNVLSSLAEIWKPAEPVSNDSNDMYGTDSDMTMSLELIDRHSY